MPFTYNLSLGDSIDQDEDFVFESWIDDVWGSFHRDKVAFANLSGPHGNGKAYTNSPCALQERESLRSGQAITSETLLGTAVADGESIPYGKPYSVFKYDVQ